MAPLPPSALYAQYMSSMLSRTASGQQRWRIYFSWLWIMRSRSMHVIPVWTAVVTVRAVLAWKNKRFTKNESPARITPNRASSQYVVMNESKDHPPLIRQVLKLPVYQYLDIADLFERAVHQYLLLGHGFQSAQNIHLERRPYHHRLCGLRPITPYAI